MSGHSKWHSIKHKKAAIDSKRGKLFTKIIREITVAARFGGGNPDTNPRLRLALLNAKGANMPSDNIDRAVKKGTGDLPGVIYEEITYEGYGAGGVAILVKCLTDNKNRTTAEVRHTFSRQNGNMAGAGSVAWIFELKGLITVNVSDAPEEKLFEIVIDAGAEDLAAEGDVYEIVTPPAQLEQVKAKITEAKIAINSSDLTMLPKNTMKLGASEAKSVLNLIEALEDQDDVQNVYANLDISDEMIEE